MRIPSTVLKLSITGLLGVSIALLIIEFGTRLGVNLLPGAWQQLAPLRREDSYRAEDLFMYDRDIGFKLRPDIRDLPYTPSGPQSRFTVTTTSLGFKNIGFRDNGISSDFVNIAVGDSFTFCWASQEDCWVELLEQKSGQDFVNMGAPGYGGRHEVYILEHYALALKPDLILWGFYANDLYDNVREDSPVRVNRWTWLERHSVLYSAIRNFVAPLPPPPGLSDPSWPWILDKGTVRTYFYHESDISKWLSDRALQEGWAIQQASLLRAKELTDTAEIELVVVLFPYREQLYFEEYRTFAPEFIWKEIVKPYQLMLDFCQENSIDVLDLTGTFVNHNQEQFIYERDTHLNPLGNAIAADAIYEYLVSHRYTRSIGMN